MKHDLSTLNLAALCKLPTWDGGPKGYYLQRDPGNGCSGDPPGFPTYFTRSIYTPRGNNPNRGPEEVISIEGVDYVTRADDDWRKGDTWDAVRDRYLARMRRLYIPLPFDHPRVQAWIAATMRHTQHMYLDPEGLAAEKSDSGRIVFPTPHYKLRAFRDDPRFSEEWRTAEKTAIEAFNADVRARYARVATLANHCGTRAIREFYPEYTPELDADGRPIDVPADAPRGGDWWQRHAEQPSAAECVPPSWLGPHRAEGWCQFCGHETAKETA